jgi:glycopeptide antibiotics resistance protein
MIQISYGTMVIFISALWVLVRGAVFYKTKSFSLKRELDLILIYICLIVVARFTFFPFSKVDGKIQPLIFDSDRAFPPRLNFLPIIYLLDYEIRREAMLNLIGNTAMFIPIGIFWPLVFKPLDSHKKVIAAGVGFSLFIEILQLPFFDRVTDIDDLLLNSLGFLAGYGLYLMGKKLLKKRN